MSRHDGDGRLTVLRHGYARVGDRDPDAVVVDDGAWFDLADYPETAAALEGGVFTATLDRGDPAEREYLAANGYAEILGAGAPAAGAQWLVELCADALGGALAPHQGLLRVLTELAVTGASADPAGAAPTRHTSRPRTSRPTPHHAGPRRGQPVSAPTEGP